MISWFINKFFKTIFSQDQFHQNIESYFFVHSFFHLGSSVTMVQTLHCLYFFFQFKSIALPFLFSTPFDYSSRFVFFEMIIVKQTRNLNENVKVDFKGIFPILPSNLSTIQILPNKFAVVVIIRSSEQSQHLFQTSSNLSRLSLSLSLFPRFQDSK